MNEKKYLYGLDLSFTSGIAVYELEEKKFVYITKIDVDKVRLTAKEKREFKLEHGKKLRIIREEFLKIVEQFPPFFVAYEGMFSKHKKETIALAKVHSIFNEICADIPTSQIQPTSAKLIVAGSGRATKEQVLNAIHHNIPDLEFVDDSGFDISDAVSIALAQLIQAEMIEWEIPEIKKKVKKVVKKKVVDKKGD